MRGAFERVRLARAGLRAAAVDGMRRARYPRGAVGGEEEYQLRDLFGRADAPERVRRLRVFEEGRVSLVRHAAAAVNVCDDDAGVDGVDAYALGRELQRGAARELVDARLRYAVGEHAGECAQARHARNVYDAARTPFQMRGGELHEVKDRAQVDVHHRVPLGE